MSFFVSPSLSLTASITCTGVFLCGHVYFLLTHISYSDTLRTIVSQHNVDCQQRRNMAHEFESGFFTELPAWHKRGRVIQDAPTVEDGIRLAGLDWDVEERPL